VPLLTDKVKRASQRLTWVAVTKRIGRTGTLSETEVLVVDDSVTEPVREDASVRSRESSPVSSGVKVGEAVMVGLTVWPLGVEVGPVEAVGLWLGV
jgi:hypothetical protein